MSKEITEIDETLLADIQSLIERTKQQVTQKINAGLVLMYWHIGKRINDEILVNNRAAYGKNIITNLAEQLTLHHGRSFVARNLRRMVQFSAQFPDVKIVSTLSTQLSWSHFIELLPIKEEEKRYFYANKIAQEHWSIRHTRKQIERKVYERSFIANEQLPSTIEETTNTFKDPYILDFLGLRDGFLEDDLERAILKELELFILELGVGFTFVERQKRMIIDEQDFYLDLLFYHRRLQRLVAIELKIGKFKASYKGQMELYLRWLDKYEKQPHEKFPIGLILCAETSQEQIELLEMHKDGIMVAEYWTELPPKKLLEEKIHSALMEARERLAKKKLD